MQTQTRSQGFEEFEQLSSAVLLVGVVSGERYDSRE